MVQFSLTIINQCCLFVIYCVFVVIVFGDWIEIPQVNKFQTRYHYNKPSTRSPIDYKQQFATTSERTPYGAGVTTTESHKFIKSSSTPTNLNNNDYGTTTTETYNNSDENDDSDNDKIIYVNGYVNDNTKSQVVEKADFADNRYLMPDYVGGTKETQINKPELGKDHIANDAKPNKKTKPGITSDPNVMMPVTTSPTPLNRLNKNKHQSTTETSIDDLISVDVDEDDETNRQESLQGDENQYYNDREDEAHNDGINNEGAQNNEKTFSEKESLYSSSIGGFLPLLKDIQETLTTFSSSAASSSVPTHDNTKNNNNKKQTTSTKIQLLEQIQDELLTNINYRINKLWGEPAEKELRQKREIARLFKDKGHEDHDHHHYEEDEGHHVNFPSNSAALLALSFLTFAVFLIKLVLHVIHALKMKYALMKTTPAPTLLRIRRNSEADGFQEDYDQTSRVLNMIDSYPFN